MADLLKRLTKLIGRLSVSKIELSAGPPFVKLIFERSELEGLLASREKVAEFVSHTFIRRSVYWIDIKKEDISEVITSLTRAEAELDTFSKELGKSEDSDNRALRKFVRSVADATHLTRNELEGQAKDIQDQKNYDLGYDSAGEDRVSALGDALLSLRRRSYPTWQMLIDLMPEDDPAKAEAQRLLNTGLDATRDAALMRDVQPELDEA